MSRARALLLLLLGPLLAARARADRIPPMTLSAATPAEGNAQLVAVHPDGRRWASALPQGVVWLWDGARSIGTFESHPLHALGFTPDGRTLLASPYRHDLAGGAAKDAPDPLHSLNATERRYELVTSALSPDGKRLVAVASFRPGRGLGASGARPAAPEQVLLVDPASGKVQKTLWKGREPRCEAAAASADVVAVAGVEIWLWERAAKARRVLAGPAAQVRQLAFSPDGSILAAADADGMVTLFRAGRPLARWKAHDDNAPRLAFHPRRPVLATGAGDGLVKLWSLDGAPLGEAREAGGMVQDLAFSPDGKRLLAAAGGRPVWFGVTGD